MHPSASRAVALAALVAAQFAYPRPAAAQDANPAIRLPAAERRDAVNAALVRLADPTLRAVVGGPVPTLLLESGTAGHAASGRIGIQAGDFVADVTVRGVIDSGTGRAVLADLDGLRQSSTAALALSWTNYPASVRQHALTAAAVRCGLDRERAVDARPCDSRDVAARLDARRLFLAGASYRFGPDAFTFAPAPGADSVTVTRVNWSVEARAGIAFSDRVSMGAVYAHTVSYRAGDTHWLCGPADAGWLDCGEIVIGPPTRSRVRTLSIEARRLLGAGVAISPRVTLALGSRGVAVECPVYILRTAKGGLAGGLTVGWRHSRTAGTGLQVTLFAGQMFGVLFR